MLKRTYSIWLKFLVSDDPNVGLNRTALLYGSYSILLSTVCTHTQCLPSAKIFLQRGVCPWLFLVWREKAICIRYPTKKTCFMPFVLFRLIWTFTNLDRVRSRAYTHQELQWLWFYKCNRLIKRFYFSGTKFGDMMSENLVHINPGSGACLQMEWSMVSLRLPSQQPWRLFPVWWTLPLMAIMASIIECKLQQIFV